MNCFWRGCTTWTDAGFPPQGSWIKSIKPDIVVKITYKHQFPVVCAFPTLLSPCRNVHPSSFSSYLWITQVGEFKEGRRGGGTKTGWAGGCRRFSSSLIGRRWRPFGRWNVINERMKERRAFVAVIEHPNGPTRLCLCDPPPPPDFFNMNRIILQLFAIGFCFAVGKKKKKISFFCFCLDVWNKKNKWEFGPLRF